MFMSGGWLDRDLVLYNRLYQGKLKMEGGGRRGEGMGSSRNWEVRERVWHLFPEKNMTF